MYILGLTHPMAWNNAAALLDDGEVVLFVEEERLNRSKQSHGLAPILALDRCLEAAGISLRDVDHIGVGWDVGVWKRRKDKIVWDFEFKQLPLDPEDERIRYLRHHLTHAISAFDPSPFESAAVISFDGAGESESGILGFADDSGLKVLKTIHRRESWGYLFGQVTKKLGFKDHQDEGKVMGLAAYGTPDMDRFSFIDWDRDIPSIHKNKFRRFLAGIEARKPEEEIRTSHMDLASTLQAVFERGLVSMAEWLASRTGSENLCLAGGCALNCAGNGALLRSGLFKRMYVQPASHDAGTALGSALAVHREIAGSRSPVRMVHAYMGPGFSEGEILRLLRNSQWKRFRRMSDPGEAAEPLAEGKVLGWFQGRMEVGPRALGGRSILADPRDPTMRDRVNRIKGREPWRPLAPAMLAEEGRTFLRESAPSPFMLIAFTATPRAFERIPAVVHVDGTIRAQLVEREENPPFHRLLSRFKEMTGVGAVLNTSFNARGEPIVCTPRDALQTFFSMGLDMMALGDYLVWK